MERHTELAELAILCARKARATEDSRLAEALWKLACEYQARAGEGGAKPDIGLPPDRKAGEDR